MSNQSTNPVYCFCPTCRMVAALQFPLEWRCENCGVSTKLVFEPTGNELNLENLLEHMWDSRVLGFTMPDGKRPRFWVENGELCAKIGDMGDVYTSISPIGAVLSMCAALVVAGVCYNARGKIANLYYHDQRNNPDTAEQLQAERLEKQAQWDAHVEKMQTMLGMKSKSKR